jgi:hypothetical protein
MAVVTANETVLQNLADYSVALPLLRTDDPIYPDSFFISWILRLAQFTLLKVMAQPSVFAQCLRSLLRETEDFGDDLAERLARLLVLGKVLIEKQTAAVIPTWIDLLLEYRDLVARSQDMYRSAGRHVPDKSMERLGLGLMFVVQCLGTQEVAALTYVFDRLDSLDQDARNAIFAAVDEVPGESSMMVNPAWLAEAERHSLVWNDAASRLGRMADQAGGWGRRELALRCHTARAVMADEYGKQPETALAMLDEATSLLGRDPILARARAKILCSPNAKPSATRRWPEKPPPPTYWVSSTARPATSPPYSTQCSKGRCACVGRRLASLQSMTRNTTKSSQLMAFRSNWPILSDRLSVSTQGVCPIVSGAAKIPSRFRILLP